MYQYPRTKFVDTLGFGTQLLHVDSEFAEVTYADTDDKVFEETIDLQHSVETLIRIAQEKHGMDVEAYRARVIEKNRARGYYD